MTTTSIYISTPGEILKEEFLSPLGISQYKLAKAIGKPQSAVSEIVRGQRSITAEMAILLSEALGTTPQFWMNLEANYQIKTCKRKSHTKVIPLHREA
ncbi:MAG: HigA family addiction module antitoxin [Coriobacteriia bacterium]|nr:HigA family addiction module antitoxin [Coriobacteriia bacterium]